MFIDGCFWHSCEAHYNIGTGTPNMQQRVLVLCRAARRSPGDVAAKVLDQLLTALRVDGTFDSADPQTKERVDTLRRALAAHGAVLDDAGISRSTRSTSARAAEPPSTSSLHGCAATLGPRCAHWWRQGAPGVDL